MTNSRDNSEIYTAALANQKLDNLILAAVREKKGVLNETILKAGVTQFKDAAYSASFMKNIAPNLSNEELFNITRSLMAAHVNSPENANIPLLQTSGLLSGQLYAILAQRCEYDPANPEKKYLPLMDVLNYYVAKNMNTPVTGSRPPSLPANYDFNQKAMAAAKRGRLAQWYDRMKAQNANQPLAAGDLVETQKFLKKAVNEADPVKTSKLLKDAKEFLDRADKKLGAYANKKNPDKNKVEVTRAAIDKFDGLIEKMKLNESRLTEMRQLLTDYLTLRANDPSFQKNALLSKVKELRDAFTSLDDYSKNKFLSILKDTKQDKLQNVLLKKERDNVLTIKSSDNTSEDRLLDNKLKTLASSLASTASVSENYEFNTNDFGTSVVKKGSMTESSNDNLTVALESADAHKDSPFVLADAMFHDDKSTSDDPLTAIIESLEALRKTNLNKQNLQGQPEKTMQDFETRYRDTLSNQLITLRKNADTLNDVKLDDPMAEKLLSIQRVLSKEVDTKSDRISRAEEIISIVDTDLIKSLEDFQQHQNQSTHRPV